MSEAYGNTMFIILILLIILQQVSSYFDGRAIKRLQTSRNILADIVALHQDIIESIYEVECSHTEQLLDAGITKDHFNKVYTQYEVEAEEDKLSEPAPWPSPPVRLCCGERHYGVICPDGKVVCEICYGRFDLEQLGPLRTFAARENVCQECADAEYKLLRELTEDE